MQDLNFLNFDGSNVTDLCLMNQYQFEKHRKNVIDPERAILCVNNLNTFALYIEEHNLIIHQSFKVAKSSMEAINRKILRKIGLTTTVLDDRKKFYQLLENRKPMIWRLFRDPLCRALSGFNFIKKFQYHHYGNHWDITKFDPYMGQDPHFLPQTGTLPAYIDDKIYQSSLQRCTEDNREFFDNRLWCYDNLKDLKPYENIEYFWLNEISEHNHNVFDFMLSKLGINSTADILTVGDQNIDMERVGRENFSEERIRSFDEESIERIYTAYESERHFLNSLTWQNMDPVFYK